MGKLHLAIDGVDVEVDQGTTILEAARGAGIYIPTLCFHPDLPLSLAVCRLCVVEATEAESRFPSSCVTPVARGMIVRTNTPAVRELRRHFFKALLTPLPSPRLNMPGLKKLADYIGVEEGDFPPYVSRNLPVDRDQPLFELDHNRCILCGLCIRACKELRGVGAIDFSLKGESWTAGPFPSPSLKENGCRFCGLCVEACPTGALTDRDGGWVDRDKPQAPCTQACPAGVDVPRYVWLIGQRRFDDAAAVIREEVTFPGVLGRVCPHPCEEKCQRAALTEPIAIAALKRTAEEQSVSWHQNLPAVVATGKKIAIVGSGPCGLTAGYHLARKGHSVTVFEETLEPGGMMRLCIPSYRLPRHILAQEIEEIKRAGVAIKTGAKVESVSKLFQQGYNAVLLATGAHQSLKLGIEGENGPGVMNGVAFLKDANLGKVRHIEGWIAVVGGGNAAIDSARVALRMGAQRVTILYRRSRTEMPADVEQVEAALEEGIEIEFLTAPTKILRKGGSLQVECIRMKLGEKDASGRQRPLPIEGSERVLEFDTLLAAIGETAESSFIGENDSVQIGNTGLIAVDESGVTTDMPGVYAAGDAVSGPSTVIEAIAMGKKAAASIDKYLGGDGDISENLIEPAVPNLRAEPVEDFADLNRVRKPCLPVEQRMILAPDGTFPEVELGFTGAMASEEASRCLQCQLRFSISPVVPLPAKQAR